jgi:hypothetical protein
MVVSTMGELNIPAGAALRDKLAWAKKKAASA